MTEDYLKTAKTQRDCMLGSRHYGDYEKKMLKVAKVSALIAIGDELRALNKHFRKGQTCIVEAV